MSSDWYPAGGSNGRNCCFTLISHGFTYRVAEITYETPHDCVAIANPLH
ncbi:MAG: hypothetical protein WBA57_10355 [Elainellaceae cyanobacterium]